jgi:hypothetical protein
MVVLADRFSQETKATNEDKKITLFPELNPIHTLIRGRISSPA